jgi:putative membrane protein
MPHRPTGTTNELAKERNRAAAERTLISWMQNCVSLIGFGIAFDRIFNAINRSFPSNNPGFNTALTTVISLGAIAVGVLLLLLAIVSYLEQIQRLEQTNGSSDLTPSERSLHLTTTAVILFGVATAIVIVIILTSD